MRKSTASDCWVATKGVCLLEICRGEVRMFLESRLSVAIGIILILIGGADVLLAWRYADAAKHEATAVGVITYISGGRSSSYNYAFEIDGVRLIQDCGTCRTALTPQGCRLGAKVLVYYAHLPVLITRLQEFGAASREKLSWGVCLIVGGLLLIVLHFVFQRMAGPPDESEEPHEYEPGDGHDALHIVPGE